ncbi:hypothetical protein [Nonomuraea sp. NPDC049400]|uniref:hypothetical protein n=1 Tax=Nonomuraea sp. NPDC049400 TaxID=3364352 RepID=UPI0037BC6A41
MKASMVMATTIRSKFPEKTVLGGKFHTQMLGFPRQVKPSPATNAEASQRTPAAAARKEVQCTGTDDATTINNAIEASKAGDEIVILGQSVAPDKPAVCVINKTIVLRGDRTYRGDSRTGLTIRQADGANLPAMLASDTWAADETRPVCTTRRRAARR